MFSLIQIIFIYYFRVTTKMEEEKNLSLTSKVLLATAGMVTGWLPARTQLYLTKGNNEDAYFMSVGSRVFNELVGVYGTAALTAKMFGADIDFTPGNIATYTGLPILIDTFMRETIAVFAYNQDPCFRKRQAVWGEPIIQILDSIKRPGWYKYYNSTTNKIIKMPEDDLFDVTGENFRDN